MLISLKKLMHYNLKTTDGKIGTVKDFLFDDKKWTVRYAVANTGNWLIDRSVLISPYVLSRPNWDEKEFNIGLTKKQVEDSPKIDKDKPVSRQHENRLVDYYGWPIYWGGVGTEFYPAVRTMAYPADALKPGASSEEKYDPNLRSTNEVLGYDIDATDAGLGHVDDFIVDLEHWQIQYLVVDTKNFLSRGKKVIIAIYWADSIDFNHERVKVDLTWDQIEYSPEFDPSEPVNREYEERLYDYYGRPKYWENITEDNMTNKEKYVEAMHKKLDEFDSKIDKLEEMIESKKDDMGEQYKEVKKSLLQQKEQLNKKKEEFQNSGESALDELKKGYENVVEELETSIKNAFEQIK